MFVVTAIISCVIKICGLFKSTEWRHFENVKFEALSARCAGPFLMKTLNFDNQAEKFLVTPIKKLKKYQCN